MLRGVQGASRRRFIGLTGGAGATALLLACGRGQSTGSQTADQTSKPKPGGQLNVRVPVDIIDYDPTYNGKTQPGDLAEGQGQGTLLTFKSGPDVDYGTMIPQPSIAERWEVTPDGTTFTFHLRQGVKFASLPPVNGRELTSDDVRWTIDYYSRGRAFKDKNLPESAVGFMYEGLQSVETPDKYTVTVRFAQPFLPFLSYAASGWNPIVPHEIYDQDGSLKDRIAGAGPYQLDSASSQKSTLYVWKKNPNYWGAGVPYIDTVRWLVLPQQATANSAFQTKQVDLLQSIAFPAYQQVKNANPDARFFRYLQPQGYHLTFSQARPGPLTDQRVRQAFALAVDRDEINKTVAGGQGQWAVTGAVQGLFTDAEAHQLMKQDLTQAKALLSAAGFANGLRLEWPYEDDISQDNLTWFQLIQAQVKRAGIDLALVPMAKTEQRAKRRKSDYDVDVLQGLGLLEADADSMMYGTYASKGTTNWSKIKDPQLDKLLEAQRSEVDPTKRRQIQQDAAKRIVDQSWGVELIYPPIWDVTQPYLQNYYPHFSIRAPFVTSWLSK
jgi:peptide/nickel transport system substrate-binding protein